MIAWMSKRTSDLLDRYGAEVYGFDMERDAADAWCSVTIGGVTQHIHLGDVRGLSYGAIDRRFAGAMLQYALDTASDIFADRAEEAYALADDLLY